MQLSKLVKAAIAGALVLCPSVQAVVIVGGDGSGNTTGAGVNGWAYTGGVLFSNGSVNASGVYLGNYSGSSWILTANHVASSGLGSFVLGEHSYDFVTGTGQQIGSADLYVIQITSGNEIALSALSSLQNLNLSSATPSAGGSVTMIGYGLDRSPSSTTWYIKDGVWHTSPPAEPYTTRTGFTTESTHSKRWGTNVVTGTSSLSGMSVGYTTFDSNAGVNEAQAVVGDSGGGVFIVDGASPTLSGLMVSVGVFSNQPSNTAVYGNLTYYADISAYRTEILSAIPEPGSTPLLIGTALICCLALLWSNRRRPSP